MNIEKLYTLARVACIEYARASGIEKDVENWVDSCLTRCPDIAACYVIAAQLRDELTKKSGRGSALSAAKRVLKSAKKATANTAMHGTWTTEEGQNFCDGYRGFILKTPIPGLPESIPGDHGYFDLQRVVDSAEKTGTQDITALIPDVPGIKALIAQLKAEHPDAFKQGRPGVPVEIKGTSVYVNPQYLIDVLEILPDSRIYAGHKYEPVYFVSDSGRGVLLPVRTKNVYEYPVFPVKGAEK